MSDSIFYYTSNFVLKEWFKNEKIWATRSITSNDKTDTIYMSEHFSEVQDYLDLNTDWSLDEICNILDYTKKVLYAEKSISLRVLKNFMFYSVTKNYNDILSAINYVIEAKEDILELKKEDLGCMYKEFPEENVLENFYMELIRNFKLDELCQILGMDVNNISEDAIESAIGASYPYVICFTEERDNRFLWDSYTNNEGICIEFSKAELESYFQKEYGTECIFRKVLYEKEEQFKYIANILNIMKLVTDTDTGRYYNLAEMFSQIGAFIKNPYWNVENEIRAMFVSKYFNDKCFKVKENYNLKYKSEYETQDYIEIAIPKELIKSITLGPLNSRKNISKEIIEYFCDKILESKGKDVIVSRENN